MTCPVNVSLSGGYPDGRTRRRGQEPAEPPQVGGISVGFSASTTGTPFENNAPRMRYKWFRSRGLFVGSGLVESGCKAVIGQASRPDDRIWQQRHYQTGTA